MSLKLKNVVLFFKIFCICIRGFLLSFIVIPYDSLSPFRVLFVCLTIVLGAGIGFSFSVFLVLGAGIGLSVGGNTNIFTPSLIFLSFSGNRFPKPLHPLFNISEKFFRDLHDPCDKPIFRRFFKILATNFRIHILLFFIWIL